MSHLLVKFLLMILFCNRHGMTNFTTRKSGKRICNKCETYRSKKYRLNLKQKAVEYKGGKCKICGYNKCLKSLDFHHRDPLRKDFAIGETRSGKKIIRAWESVKIELDKCDLLCKNCHGEVHDEINKSNDEPLYNIHRKNIELINNQLCRQYKTPQQLMTEIEQGKFDAPIKFNAAELRHQQWILRNT